MNYTYYPGCSLEASADSYDKSLKSVFSSLGLGLQELEDWNCCGATAYMSVKETVSLTISARNLALAEKNGLDIVAPCSACYTVLAKTHKIIAENPELHDCVNSALGEVGLSYNLGCRVRHPLDVLVNDVGIARLAAQARVSLQGLKIAQYYGCQIVRPYATFDDAENPVTMDNLFGALGAESVYYPNKVRCCGGMLMFTFTDVALKLTDELLRCAQENGADLILTTCPMCQTNLDMHMQEIKESYGRSYTIPTLFFTELLGVALGHGIAEMGLDRHMVPISDSTRKLLETKK
ncbi:MAG: disulfide reductase [Candidatus Zixiibacteriota bacterium]|nr:MAG: disulfide reductase [candidate division Zixibacteria bacterium]